jgi:D-glucuronyl C5-epimerase C-terminus
VVRRLFAVVVAMAAFAGSAAAAPVVELGPGPHARVREDRFLTMPALTPAPTSAASATASGGPSVPTLLSRLYRSGAISHQAYSAYHASWRAATATAGRLSGTRAGELGSVIANVRAIAARGMLNASRLPALFLTLDRNRQWWSSGPLLSSGQRVEFTGSQLVWEYYPGQGIELTMLGNFGKADGLYTAGPAQYPKMVSLLGELIPLAALRGGAPTWEYYFNFDGGAPPWTSAMSQGTALEALSRAAKALRQQPATSPYLALAHRALGPFTMAPPVGVAVNTALGHRYLQYSFAPSPGADVINGFLQSLIGLYDYAQVSGDQLAQTLFAAGNAEAQAEVPRFDTGAWSLYQPGQEDSLSYHQLVTGFLSELCERTHAAVYCTTAQHFAAYLKTPPTLALLTTRLTLHQPGLLRFRLSKISRVGIVVARGSQTLLATSAMFPYGIHAFSVPAPSQKGLYTVRLSATDLAGNFNRIQGSVRVAG